MYIIDYTINHAVYFTISKHRSENLSGVRNEICRTVIISVMRGSLESMDDPAEVPIKEQVIHHAPSYDPTSHKFLPAATVTAAADDGAHADAVSVTATTKDTLALPVGAAAAAAAS